MIEYDITYDPIRKSYRVMVDTGEEVVYFDRCDLLDMLNLLDEADESL